MEKKHKYVSWEKINKYVTWDKINEEENEERKKRHEEIDRKKNILIGLLIENFDNLFRIDGYKNGEPIYIYDYASDWSDAPHLKIAYDDWYKDGDKYWDFFRRGANSGEIFRNREDAFRCYLEVYYGVGDLDKDGTGFPSEINDIIKEQDL